MKRPSDITLTMSQARGVLSRPHALTAKPTEKSCCENCRDGRPCVRGNTTNRTTRQARETSSPRSCMNCGECWPCAHQGIGPPERSPTTETRSPQNPPARFLSAAVDLLPGKTAVAILRPQVPPPDRTPTTRLMRPGVLSSGPLRPRWCPGDSQEDFPGAPPPGPQKCDPELPEDQDPPRPAPRFPQYPWIDCTPEFRAQRPRIGGECSGSWGVYTQWADVLLVHHERAYRIVKCAARTITWISHLNGPSQEFYWNWGGDQFSEFSEWWGGPGNAQAQLASLAYWFGPYTYNSFQTVKNTLTKMVDAYENGTHTLFRRPMTYFCSDVCAPAIAQHWRNPFTRICSTFWQGCDVNGCPGIDTNWGRFRVWTLIHEWFHNIRNSIRPHDACSSACNSGTFGWKCYWGTGHSHQCYQDEAVSASWFFNPGDGGSPRSLVEAENIQIALDNVDNFVSWCIARWLDPQWGFCDGPRKLLNKAPAP